MIRYTCVDYPDDWARDGVSVGLCRTRLGGNPCLAGLKHLNRLEQVLARSEWGDGAIAEGLMCDGRGRVIAGTMSNLFVCRGDQLVTPRLDTCGIAGTVRGLVLGMAPRFGLEAIEGDLFGHDVNASDGMFLTNALIGVWPVKRLDDHRWDVRHLPWHFLEAVRTAAHTPESEV
jgi:4-amino-4-deoxychorismate lyase